MTKKYKSTLEMIKDVSEDADLKKNLKQTFHEYKIAKALFAMRSEKGLTQASLAKKMGVSQGTVSKMEKSSNVEFDTGQLADFCEHVGMRLEVQFVPASLRLVDRVKIEYFKILDLLADLREMAQGDKAMETAVRDFHEEALEQVTIGLFNAFEKTKAEKQKGTITVGEPMLPQKSKSFHARELAPSV